MESASFLQQPALWIALIVAFALGLLSGISLHASHFRRQRLKLARSHINEMFATGQISSIRYQPVRGWFGDKSRVLASHNGEEYEVPDKLTSSQELASTRLLGGFTAAEACAAADNLRSNPAYVTEEWTSRSGKNRKAWIVKRREHAQAA